MIKKNIFQKKLIRIIEDKYTNWEQKASLVEKIITEEENGEELFKDLIITHNKSKIRKGAASILGYMKNFEMPKELISRIIEENDWTVRYALSKSCVKHMRKEAIDRLLSVFNEQVNTAEMASKHNLKLIFAESLGYMEIKEAEPILTAMLRDIGKNRDPESIELIIQILYSLGEVGDKSTVELLIHYSANNVYMTEGIRNSAKHAIDKIAKRLKFSSKKDLLEAINKE
ncbi:MAG: hypothetical protein GNW80_04425 [Asgard group archaeon]|nr:hypothetical protein [Asgard group archaeon]